MFHHQDDQADSWSEKPWHPRLNAPRGARKHRNYALADNIKRIKRTKKGPAFESAEVEDEAYYDGQIAAAANAKIKELATLGKPFFLAVGFLKPHLPFNAPSKYWDLYDPAQIDLEKNPLFPEDAPEVARHKWGELRKYADIPPAPALLDDDTARQLIHGYYASTSYVDAQVGKVMDSLKQANLLQDTLIVLIGDHGWSLGEHGLWAKHSPFDVATRTPLIVSHGKSIPAPGVAAGLVEFVDIYPTVLELLALPAPRHLQGESFARLLRNPKDKGKEQVFIHWKNARTVRTERYSYTIWQDKKKRIIADMLYDLVADPRETTNLAVLKDYQDDIDSLRELLKSETVITQ